MSPSALRWIVLVSLTLGGLFAVGELVASRDMTFPQDPADRIAEFAADPTATLATGMLFLGSQFALLVGVVALAPLLPTGRGAKTTAVGFWAFFLGLAGHLVVGGVNFSIAVLATAGQPEAAVALMTTSEASAPLIPFFALGLLGFALGFILLGVGFYRARVLTLPLAALFWVSIPLEFVLGNLSPYAAIAGRVVFLGALLGLGLSLRRPGPIETTDAAPA